VPWPFPPRRTRNLHAERLGRRSVNLIRADTGLLVALQRETQRRLGAINQPDQYPCGATRVKRAQRFQDGSGLAAIRRVTESRYRRDRAPGHQPRRSRSENTRESTPANGATAKSPITITRMMIRESTGGA